MAPGGWKGTFWSGQARRRLGGGVLDIMHDHSRITTDPRIPTLPGRSTSGFHRPGRHGLHQARGAVRYPASCKKGELRPTKTACEADLQMDGSFNELIEYPE